MGKQWTPPSSDSPVATSTWKPPATDEELKKKSSNGSPVATNGSQPSDNGSNNFQNSLDPFNVTKNNPAPFTNNQAKQDAIENEQSTDNPQNQPNVPAAPSLPSGTADNPAEDVSSGAAPSDKGSYGPGNIAGQIDKAFAVVPKTAGFVSSVVDNINNFLTPNSLLDKAPGLKVSPVTKALNWASDYMTKLGDDMPLPNTFVGKTVNSLADAVPLIAGGEVAKGADLLGTGTDLAGNYLSKLDIFQSAVTKAAGPLTQYMATSGALSKAADAYRGSGGKFLPTLEGGVEGFNEGVTGGATLELQMAAGGQIGSTLFKKMVAAGLATEEGVLTEQAIKSFIGSPSTFAAGSIAGNLASGNPIDWQQAGISAVTALPFEAPHVLEAYSQGQEIKEGKKTLDASINKAIQVRDNNAIFNFSQADPGDVLEAMQRPESSQELQVQALEKGVQAQNSNTYKEKNTLHSQQIDLQNAADIKRIGETIINTGVDGFVQGVNNTQLPDDVKANLVNKANAVNKVFNPVEVQKTEIGKGINDLNTQIEALHATPENADPNIVSDNLVKLNDLIGKRVKSQSDLFDLSYQDNTQQQKGVALANNVAENPVSNPAGAPQPAPIIPVENPFFKNLHITDVLPDGKLNLVHDDGLIQNVTPEEGRNLGITDDHIADFQKADAERVKAEQTKQTDNTPGEIGKKEVAIDNSYLKGAHLIDAHDNGDVTVRDKDGRIDRINDTDRQHLGITDDQVKEFRNKNEIPLPESNNGNSREDLDKIGSAFQNRFGTRYKILSPEEASSFLEENDNKNIFFQILDDVDLFNNTNPTEAKKFIDKVFNTVSNDAEAKSAYRKLAVKYHPDKGGNEEVFKHLNNVNEEYKTGKLKNTSNDGSDSRYDDFRKAADDYMRNSQAEYQRKYDQENLFRTKREQFAKKQIQDVIDERKKDLEALSVETKKRQKDALDAYNDQINKINKGLLSLFKSDSDKAKSKAEAHQRYMFKLHTIDDFYRINVDHFSSKSSEKIMKIRKETGFWYQKNIKGGVSGFYDTNSNTAYLVHGVADDTTAIHEMFSHPFIQSIEKENPELFNNLLKEALSDEQVKDHVDAKYNDADDQTKQHEYIAAAIDLEAKGRLENKKLIDYIHDFWIKVKQKVSGLFQSKTAGFDKNTSVKDLVDFILKSGEKLNLNSDQNPHEGETEFEHKVRTVTDPGELATMYDDKIRELQGNLGIDGAIADYHATMRPDEFKEHSDENNINRSIAKNYFSRKGEHGIPVDTQAQEINNIHFNGTDTVTPEHIADFMVRYPAGHASYFTPTGNEELRAINDRYREVTGKNLRKDIARKLAEKYNTPISVADHAVEVINSPKNDELVRSRVSDLMHTEGLYTGEVDYDRVNEELEKYDADPTGKFNIFYDVFDGRKPHESEIEELKNIIDEHRSSQSERNRPAEEHSASGENSDTRTENSAEENTGTEDTTGTTGDAAADREPGEVKPFGAAASQGNDVNEKLDPETQEKVKNAMANLFPNIGYHYYNDVADFKKAAEENSLNSGNNTILHGFVDKNRELHFNPEYMSSETQLHEQGHILTNWAYYHAPKLYERIIEAGKRMGDMQEELRRNGYTVKGNRLFEEAFVTLLGREGDKALDAIKNPIERGNIARLIHEAWTKFERWVAGKIGFSLSTFKNIDKMSLEDFTKYVNDKYQLSDVKVSDISSADLQNKNENDATNAHQSAVPERQPGEALSDFAKRIADWKQGIGNDDPPAPKDNLEEKAGYNFSETSIKNRVTEEERRQRNMEKVEISAKRDFGQVFDNGKKMVDDGRLDPKILAENIIERPRPLSAEESAALLYNRMRLYNDHRLTMDNIADAMESGNSTAETEERLRLSYIEDSINTNDIAARKAGYEQGLGLAARKMMIADDYSLANQLQMAKIANGGRELPADIRMKIENLSKQLEEAEKRLTDYENNAAARESVKSLARLQKEVENEKKVAKKQGRKQSIEEIDKRISDRKKQIYDKLFKNNKATSTPIPYADRLVEITPDLVMLAKDYIHKGIKTVDGIVDQIHDDIKDHIEGITKRDIRDAISGYGKRAKLSTDDIDVQLREIKRQSRLISALEDAQRGEAPLKSGLERDEPSDRVRELTRQVHQTMLENGIKPEGKDISPEDAWKSALDAVKSRLKNQISDLSRQLETGEKTPKKAGIEYDQEANLLRTERDRLKQAIEDIEGKSEMSPERRIEIAKKLLEQNIREYERRIAEKDLNPQKKASKTPETPELTALRKRLEVLKDNFKQLQDDAKPKRRPEDIALDGLKKRLQAKADDLQGRLDRGDFEPAPKKDPIPLDDEAKRLQVNVNGLRRKFDEQREKIKEANKSKFEKRLNWFSKYRKFILLSNPTTVAKLSAAGATRMITTPLEEITGHGLSMIPGLTKIAAMAPREGGGLSIASEARSLAEVLSRRSINEMIRTVREGKSALDERVDVDGKTYKEHGFLELPGQIHSALKTIPKQNEYYRSLQKRIEFALKNGYDILSPDVQTSLQVESYKDANPGLFTGKAVDMTELEKKAFNDSKRAIFMQDNFLSEGWNNMIKGWEGNGKKGEVAATIAKVMIPIIKIPTNFVAETGSYAFGAAKGLLALTAGVDKLTPDDADYVLRAFKKQGVGLGFFALGYAFPNAVGGFFVEKEKRKANGPQPNDLLLFGHSVPHWLMHSPVLEMMQIGSTVRHIHDQYKHTLRESGADEVGKGALAIGKGLLGQVPLFGEPADIAKAGENTETAAKFAANFVLGLTVPYDVQRLAKAMDTDTRGHEIKRKSKGFKQELESGIPVLREKLKKK